MSDAYSILVLSAATIGLIHTAIGVDHSLPFVILAKTRGWSLAKTMAVTLVCGLGHVLSSVLIAAVGLGLGVAGHRLMWLEETRGGFAAWLLVGFGLAYAAVAFWKSRRRRVEDAGHKKEFLDHGHVPAELLEDRALSTKQLMPALFVIFLLGPCEALLPLLTASGLVLSLAQGIGVTLVFSGATIGTMMALVAAGYLGANALGLERRWGSLRRHAHTLAGLALAASGASIQLLGI